MYDIVVYYATHNILKSYIKCSFAVHRAPFFAPYTLLEFL